MLSSGQNTTDSLSVVKVPVGKGKKVLAFKWAKYIQGKLPVGKY